MFRKKIVDFFGTAMLFTGSVLAFLPHAVHTAIGISEGVPHLEHVISGVFLIIVSLVILVYNNDALNREFFKKFILHR